MAVSNTSDWGWLTLPLGTITAGGLVLIGACLTLYYTNRRFRTEQLQDRAVARERSLQEAYANWVKAAFNITKTRMLVWIIEAEFGDHEQGELPTEAMSPISTTENFQQFQRELRGYERDLLAAYSNILLIDSDPGRLEKCQPLLVLAEPTHIPHDKLPQFEDAIRSLAADVAVSLDSEYRRAAELAHQGVYPPMIVRARPITLSVSVNQPTIVQERP